MSIGVPIKVLHEAEGHIITCETITGEVYRGKLIEAEDNMNCQMTQITVTYRDGRTANLENVYIRGSKIRFLILPDMLKNAPMFKKQTGKGLGGTAGRGKAAILRAQGESCALYMCFFNSELTLCLYYLQRVVEAEELGHRVEDEAEVDHQAHLAAADVALGKEVPQADVDAAAYKTTKQRHILLLNKLREIINIGRDANTLKKSTQYCQQEQYRNETGI